MIDGAYYRDPFSVISCLGLCIVLAQLTHFQRSSSWESSFGVAFCGFHLTDHVHCQTLRSIPLIFMNTYVIHIRWR